jgi:Zn-finger nucleic acid-binding protein
MRKSTIQKVEVDGCAACNGIWFDDDELRKAKDQTDPDLKWMDFDLWKHKDRFRASEKPVKCPKCSVNMAAITYGETQIEIDHCVECKGIWLDGGDFRKIVEALTEELVTKSSQEYLRASLDEALEILAGPENFISEWRDFLTVMTMLEYRVLAENPKLHDKLTSIQAAIHQAL